MLVFRAFNIFSLVADSQNLLDYFRVLDPTRYFELTMFLDRGFFSVLFGSGLGAGIADVHGLLSFVIDDGGAFSSEELSESKFYRFHDSWIWFGLRFGLFIYFYVFYFFILAAAARKADVALGGALAFVFFINSTFSVGGLFVTAIFAIQLKMTKFQALHASYPVKRESAGRAATSY